MIVVLLVMGAVVSAVFAVVAGGLLLPRRQQVSKSITMSAPVEVIWQLLANPAEYPRWQRRIDVVDLLGTAPLQWREFGEDGSFAFRATTTDAPRQFVAVAVDDDVARNPEREFLLEPGADGTRVTYTERCTLTNPISRFVFRYLWTADETVRDVLLNLRDAAQRD